MTVAELIAELRKPGKVYVPVMANGYMLYLEAVKADVIAELSGNHHDKAAPAPWKIFNRIGAKGNGLVLDFQ